jgi:hypothetical protein
VLYAGAKSPDHPTVDFIIQNQRCHAFGAFALLAQMTDPKPDSAEAQLSKASWVVIVVGGATTVSGYMKSYYAERGNARMTQIREDIESGRLKMEPEFEYYATRASYRPSSTDYSGTILLGLIIVFVGIGLSLYSNKLRKKRTGE